MTLFRKSSAADAAPGERHCRACGGALADDQLACLECGAVDTAAGTRERRWMLPTGGLVGVALFLVTSASFAATTALNTGDPKAIKQQPPAVAQVTPPVTPPPVSGDGTAPQSSEKGPDLGSLPSGGGGAGGTDAPAAGSNDAGGSSSAGSTSGGSSSGGGSDSGNGSGSANSNSGGNSNSDDKPSEPKPAAVTVNQWQPGTEGYTVLITGYSFDTKSEARTEARKVLAKGLPAGILNTDDFASLDPGSWVVYVGQFDSPQEAEKERGGYENAGYPGDVTFVGESPTPEDQEPQGSSAGASPPQQP
jgi:predicted nucleic acid-binding Zn ribbon protein